jgi:hypothetical protein
MSRWDLGLAASFDKTKPKNRNDFNGSPNLPKHRSGLCAVLPKRTHRLKYLLYINGLSPLLRAMDRRPLCAYG